MSSYRNLDENPLFERISCPVCGNSKLRSTFTINDGRLKQKNVGDLTVVGLATDYCVKASALDAVKQGLKTCVRKDAVRAVNIQPDDGRQALEAMKLAGVEII